MLFVMLLVVAVSSMLASSLPIAVFAATVPVTLAVALNFALQGDLHNYILGVDGGDRAGLFHAAGPPALFDHARDARGARREGRADRRARTGQGDLRRGAPPRRRRQHLQVALPRADEPRAAHAAQRHPRLLRGDEERGVRPACGAGLQGIFRRHPQFRRAPAQPDQRNPRPVAHRGRPLRAQRGAGRSRAWWSRIATICCKLRAAQPRHHHPRSVRAGPAAAVGGRARAAARSASIFCPTRSSSRRRAARSGSRSAGPRPAANT